MTPAERKLTAERFLGMLECSHDKQTCCPFVVGFKGGWQADRIKCGFDSWEQCDMCMDAVGLCASEHRCPCFELGCKEAVKRAWIFIEESGVLDA